MSTYVIFGASGDIGINYIRHLERTGSDATVVAFCNSNLNRLSELDCKNINLVKVKCDFSNNEETENTLRQITEKYIDITHFISFAYGKLKYDRVTSFSATDAEIGFRIQVSSIGIALSHIIPIMKKKKFGRVIILTSSVAIGSPPSFMSEYTIVKYASLGMIKSYSAECVKYGITVNGIAPSMVNTQLWNGLPPMLAEMNMKNHPMKRAVSFDEINSCIDFLSSSEASFITGENINLSGGETI